MATKCTKTRRSRRLESVAKPAGMLHPRVIAVGPEHFGVVAVDCAKARSKWMLADFYGRILVPPTTVEHTRHGFQHALDTLRTALADHDIRDQVVAVERTGNYHLPIKQIFTKARFDVRIVHPLATNHYRLPADPDNKTDDTDLNAIHRAVLAGFGLREPHVDPLYIEMKLLARHRRELVRKNAALRNRLHAELDALLPGLSAAVGNILEHEPALEIARRVQSPQEVRTLGLDGLAGLLDAAHVRYQQRSLTKVVDWAEQAHDGADCTAVHHQLFLAIDDERRARLQAIRGVERDLATRLVHTPYVLLLSFPGINIVSAAEFAGEMGPIANYANETAITGRAGLYPSRYQSDQVDHCDGALARRANRALRYTILMIGDNLLNCNAYFKTLAAQWRTQGVEPHVMRVRAGKRFCRIAYRMVAGGAVFRHPSCRERHWILNKLTKFHVEHETPMEQVLADLQAASEQIPRTEHAAEAAPLSVVLGQATSRRRSGPCRLGEVLPVVLARLGVTLVESSAKGEPDHT